jgi:hypothetical protein
MGLVVINLKIIRQTQAGILHLRSTEKTKNKTTFYLESLSETTQ